MRLSKTGSRLPVALILAALSGAGTSLALPPADLGPVALVSLIPLLWVLRDVRPRRGALLGFVWGFVFFGLVLYWIVLFTRLGWFALTLASATAVAIFGSLAPILRRAEHPIASAAGLAAAWTILDWLRGMWPLGGFTWGGLGYTQVDNRFLLPLASVAGVWGVTFVVVLVNALLLLALERWRKTERRWSAVVPLVAAAAVVVAPALIRVPSPTGAPLDVASIQVDVRAVDAPRSSLAEDRGVAELNARLDRRLTADPPDLVVWGESALDPGARDPATWGEVTASIRSVGAPTLAGAVTVAADGRAYNQGLLFDPDGRVVQRYRKVHLVPFGEYVPWRSSLDWISALQQIPYDETPGTRLHTLQIDGLAFGNAICFENSFPSIDRTLVRDGAQFLVITTNNASYGFTAASRQHLIMSRFRAVENARWVVHAAVSGISAFIDPTGRVVARAGLFVPAITRHAIRPSTAETLFTRLGDWVPVASIGLVAGLIALPRRRRRTRPAPRSLPERVRVLVILPTYDERATVKEIVRGLLGLPEQVDVLVVDDASPDGTGRVVQDLAAGEPRVRLLERPGKAGLAGAYMAGFRHALAEGYDLVVEMDADGSHLPEELPRLLAATRDLDLVIGSRYVPGGTVSNWSRSRLALSRAGNLYARWSLGFPLHDATSGYRAFRRDALREIVAEPLRSDGYGFQIETALRAWRLGYAVGETPITFRERAHGHSKISRRIVFEALWLVTIWGLRERFRRSEPADSPRGRPDLPRGDRRRPEPDGETPAPDHDASKA